MNDPSDAPLVVRPSPLWRSVNFRELWAFRDLILLLGVRDVKLRYRQTMLGVAWVIVQPLMGATIFAFVFGRVARLETPGVPYFALALIGMVAWGGFASALARVSGSLLQNSQMISKVFFPRLVLPLSSLMAVILDLAVGVGLIAATMIYYGLVPSWRVLTLPLWLVLLFLLATGCGLFASALAVAYRDVVHVLPTLVQLAFYATPVAYTVQAVPQRFRALFLVNPLAPLFEATRWALMGVGELPIPHLAAASVTALAVFWSGAVYFRHAERHFADVI